MLSKPFDGSVLIECLATTLAQTSASELKNSGKTSGNSVATKV